MKTISKKLISLFFCLLCLSFCFTQEERDPRLDYGDGNPLIKTEFDGIYCIKPHYNNKEIIEKDKPYIIFVFEKDTKDLVKSFDNVVRDWIGMGGWNGQVVPTDYTFITKDYKQYVVKADQYTIQVIKKGKFANPKRTIRFLETLCYVQLGVLLLIVICIIIKQFNKTKAQQNHILQIQEEEKSKISREIHDTVVQDLRAIRIEAEAIQTDDLNQKNRVVEDITKCIIKMRNICYDLSPAELADAVRKDEDEIDLISIIETLCKQFTTKTNIDSSIQIDKSIKYPDFDKTTCLNVVRVFQEILNNINKHSYATKVTVLIKPPAENFLTIFVIDDGVGCKIESLNPKNFKNHFGIRNMRERMTSIGGSVDFFSSPDEGMKVVLKIKAEA